MEIKNISRHVDDSVPYITGLLLISDLAGNILIDLFTGEIGEVFEVIKDTMHTLIVRDMLIILRI